MARVTLADVARAAGVGVATASRALSAKENPDVSPRPAAARAQGVTACVQPTTAARRDSGDVVDVIAGLAEVPTEGVLILGSAGDARMLETAQSLRLPVVAIDNAADEVLVPTVGVDNRLGVLLGMRHLIAQGRRCIAYVGTGGDRPFHHARREGYREALAEAGLALDPVLMLEDPSADDASQPLLPAVEELLDSGTEIDAILCESDGGAAPVLRSLHRAGLIVPADVGVVGVDDSAVAVALDPPLTTVRQPFEQLGESSIEMLLGLISGAAPAPGRTLLPPSLVVRASTEGPAEEPAGR